MDNNEIYKITQIEQAIEVRNKLEKSWFRGHPKTYNNLIPRIFRGFYRDDIYLKFRPYYEMTAIERFKRIAPSLCSNVPGRDDDLKWLILMQHHDAPTS